MVRRTPSNYELLAPKANLSIGMRQPNGIILKVLTGATIGLAICFKAGSKRFWWKRSHISWSFAVTSCSIQRGSNAAGRRKRGNGVATGRRQPRQRFFKTFQSIRSARSSVSSGSPAHRERILKTPIFFGPVAATYALHSHVMPERIRPRSGETALRSVEIFEDVGLRLCNPTMKH